MLNKQKGNMYNFVTHTWNPIKGECEHFCTYCFMRVFSQKPLHFVEKELKDDLGENRTIFIGSSTDMFAKSVKSDWIIKVLNHCKEYPKNIYLFQSKNPKRFYEFIDFFPKDSILGTTIESNRNSNFSDAPEPRERAKAMTMLNNVTMVTIEPIMDFDLEELVFLIKTIQPKWVNIGADSKNHNLPEPSKEKILQLIEELKKFTKVNLKENLQRLL